MLTNVPTITQDGAPFDRQAAQRGRAETTAQPIQCRQMRPVSPPPPPANTGRVRNGVIRPEGKGEGGRRWNSALLPTRAHTCACWGRRRRPYPEIVIPHMSDQVETVWVTKVTAGYRLPRSPSRTREDLAPRAGVNRLGQGPEDTSCVPVMCQSPILLLHSAGYARLALPSSALSSSCVHIILDPHLLPSGLSSSRRCPISCSPRLQVPRANRPASPPSLPSGSLPIPGALPQPSVWGS